MIKRPKPRSAEQLARKIHWQKIEGLRKSITAKSNRKSEKAKVDIGDKAKPASKTKKESAVKKRPAAKQPLEIEWKA